MRRVPSLLLTAALAAATSVGVARADEPAAPQPSTPDAAPAAKAVEEVEELAARDVGNVMQSDGGTAPAPAATATPDAKVEDKAGKKKDDDKRKGPVNARLAPGGILADEKADKFPLHLTATLDNSFGQGFYAATPGASVIPVYGGDVLVDAPNVYGQPNWGTSLSLRPAASLPKWDGLPKMTVSTSIDFSVNNWLRASSNGGVYEQQLRVSDLGVGLVLPGLYKEEFTGITATPVFSARAPLSITSRQQNLFTSVGASVALGWDSPETPVGTFSFQYTPSLRGNFYTQDAPTIPCEAGVNLRGVVADPFEKADLPFAYGRTAEIAANGECVLRGRQGLASFSNNASVAWVFGDHAVSLSLGWGLGFLRPISDQPELKGLYASSQSFNENSNGSISYTYTVPVDFSLNLTAGIGSSQPAWNAAGTGLRFPFYDFVTPANNFSSAFFDVSLGI